jgi:hypothetical protein
VEGPEANALWTTLFRAAIVGSATEDHKALFQEVYEHALEVKNVTKSSWLGLYTCVIGLWLRVQPSHARAVHKEIINAFDCAHVDLRDLAMDCANSRDPLSASRVFRLIYKKFPQRNLYDAFVGSMLSDHHSARQRFEWHNFFVSRGDLPSSKVFALPTVQELFAQKGKPLPMHSQPSESVPTQSAATTLRAEHYPPLTRASMSALVGDVHGIKPKQISDAFVAKLLATWAFPLDMLVNGLGFLAIESLGPQALRQLAVRCANCGLFQEKLAELKRLGIEPKASNFARVMQHVAREGLENLFQTLLLSDQHPDTFADAKVQDALLRVFLKKNDLQNAHLTLIVLSHLNSRGNANAWNAVLKHNILERDEPGIESATRRMHSLQIAVNLVNLKLFRVRMVGYRWRSKKPGFFARRTSRIRPINYLASMAMFSLQNGINVGSDFWVELLKRYGMTGDWKNVERLTMWLLFQYSTDRNPEWAAKCGLDNSGLQRDCHTIFSGATLGALVVWGFRAPIPRLAREHSSADLRASDDSDGSLKPEPWAKGLVLLRRIQLQSNMPTLLTARKAFRQRMWILFGPAYSTRAINKETVRLKNLTLSHCVLHANQIFEGKLFPGIENFLQGPEATNTAAVMSMLFGQVKSARGREGDIDSVAEQLVPATFERLRYELRKRRRKVKSTPYYYKSMLNKQSVG